MPGSRARAIWHGRRPQGKGFLPIPDQARDHRVDLEGQRHAEPCYKSQVKTRFLLDQEVIGRLKDLARDVAEPGEDVLGDLLETYREA